MIDVNRGIAAHEISEARQLADKAGLEGDRDVYRMLHALLDAYEAIDIERGEHESKVAELEESISDFESERDSLRSDLDDAKTEIGDLTKRVRELEFVRERAAQALREVG